MIVGRAPQNPSPAGGEGKKGAGMPSASPQLRQRARALRREMTDAEANSGMRCAIADLRVSSFAAKSHSGRLSSILSASNNGSSLKWTAGNTPIRRETKGGIAGLLRTNSA